MCTHNCSDQDSDEYAFLSWLRRNGAQFEHVDWPSQCTKSCVRGALARKDIATGEHMIIIPHRLMMSEAHAKDDPELGHVHKDGLPVLRNDNGLALYVMQEKLKGNKSFYAPYLRILPQPRNLGHWEEASLIELQDPKLANRSAARRRHLVLLYEHTMKILGVKYPDLFPMDQYTFELFDFAWGTVQARAFGKRLTCSALVPLADCLNHGNVQTKYDFDVQGNGVFRLFPTGSNHYPKDVEILNSYGRRPNDNLLLEYGFAMLDNEWDEVELVFSLSSMEPTFFRKKAILRASGQHTCRMFRLRRDNWAVEMLHYQRCACTTPAELDRLAAKQARRTSVPTSTGEPGSIEDTPKHGQEHITLVGERLPGALECSGESSPAKMSKEFPFRVLSCANELAALTEVVLRVQETLDDFPTTACYDQSMLHRARCGGSHELICALAYRLTAKRVLEHQRELVELAIKFVQDIADELQSVKEYENSYKGVNFAQSVMLDEELPPSFVAYLDELRDALLPPRDANGVPSAGVGETAPSTTSRAFGHVEGESEIPSNQVTADTAIPNIQAAPIPRTVRRQSWFPL